MSTPPQGSLSAFLANLAQDPQALHDYFSDQQSAVEAADLSADHKAALLSNDQSQIVAALQEEYGADAVTTSVQVIIAPPKMVPQVIIAPPPESSETG